MATPSGLGVSTGIGKGEAQVFDPVESDYYKNKANLALKEKAAQQEEMKSIGSMPVWNRDLGLFNKKRQELIAFSQDNHRSLMEGDYAKKAKFNSMMAGLAQFAASSNAAQKGHLANKAIINKNDTKIYSGSKDEETNFSMDPGNFNVPTLRQNFNSEEFLTDLNNSIAKLDPKFQGFTKENISGTDILINNSSVAEGDIRSLIDSKTESYSKLYGDDQVKGWIKKSGTDLFNQGKAFGKTKQTSKLISPGYQQTTGQQKTKAAAQRRKEMLYKMMNNTDQFDTEVGNLLNKSNVKYGVLESVEHNTTDYPSGTVVFTFNNPKTGKFVKAVDTQKDGAYEEINSIISGLGGMDKLDDNDLSLAPAYTPAVPITQAKKSKISSKQNDLLKILTSEKTGKIFDIYSDQHEDILKEIKDPKVKKSLLSSKNITEFIKKQALGNDFGLGKITSLKENKSYGYVGDQGWDVTIDGEKFFVKKNDETGLRFLMGMPTGGSYVSDFITEVEKKLGNKKSSSSSSKAKATEALTQKQLDLAANFRAKYPEKVEGYTDEQIIQALKK